MGETEHVGMQAQPPYGVITVAILDVAADRVAQVSTMHADLILSARLQTKLYE